MGERQSLISSKRPKLARSCGYLADTCRSKHDGDDACHDCSARVALCRIVKDLDEGFVRGTCQDAVDVADAEYEGNSHDDCHDPVRYNRPDEDFWKYYGGVLHFLS